MVPGSSRHDPSIAWLRVGRDHCSPRDREQVSRPPRARQLLWTIPGRRSATPSLFRTAEKQDSGVATRLRASFTLRPCPAREQHDGRRGPVATVRVLTSSWEGRVDALLGKVQRWGIAFVAIGIGLLPVGVLVGLNVHLDGRAELMPWFPLSVGLILIGGGVDALRRAARGRQLLAGPREGVRVWIQPNQIISRKKRGRIIAIQTAAGDRLTSFVNGPAANPPQFQTANERGALIGSFAHGQWIIVVCGSGACLGRVDAPPTSEPPHPNAD